MPDPRPDALHARLRTAQMPRRGVPAPGEPQPMPTPEAREQMDRLFGGTALAYVDPEPTGTVVVPDHAPLAPGYSAMMDALNAATAPRTPDPGRYAAGGVLHTTGDPLADAFGSGPWREPTYPHRDPHQPAYDEDAYRD